jgi:DUF971 family protein
MNSPLHIDLKKDRGLTIAWADGSSSYYSILYLRKMSPSAEARELRDQIKKNPLTVLPSSTFPPRSAPGAPQQLTALSAELVGNYALRITFSDGHSTGIYSWDYLREIDPHTQDERQTPPEGAGDIHRDQIT